MTGADFRKALDRLGLSQVEAARLFDVNKRTVTRWISDEVPVPQSHAILLTLAIRKKLKPDYLLTLIEKENRA